MLTEKENEVLEILKKEDALLDSMLAVQAKIHTNIREKKWVELEDNIYQSKLISDAFVEADALRDQVVGDNVSFYFTDEVLPVFTRVRSKLSKSKIENQALASYVDVSRKLIQNFIDDCADSKNATTYSPKGFVKPEVKSVMVNRVF